jgi:hypothetical protein
MSDLKDLLNKIRVENTTAPVVKEENEESDYSDGGYMESTTCYYLNEDGTCSDGCSCAEVSIEQECPFMSANDYESCCCFEAAGEEEEYSEDEDE